jgi:hypothetical protein
MESKIQPSGQLPSAPPARRVRARPPIRFAAPIGPGLLGAALMLLVLHPVHAQGRASSATEPVAAGASFPGAGLFSYWPSRIRDTFQDALAPLYAGVSDLLRPVRGIELAWGTPERAQRFGPDAARAWRDLAQISGYRVSAAGDFAPQHPTVSLGYLGAGTGVSLARYRIAWLITPELTMHAMPTLSLAAGGALRLDLMAGSIGGRSGTSAACFQLVYRLPTGARQIFDFTWTGSA